MAGGLINIVSYSSSDLYLTGSPQITFYKMVYRRYTNFAMEVVALDFDDQLKFDHESELITPRIADLVHKGYLHVQIPSLSILKSDVGIDITDIKFDYADKNSVSNFNQVKTVYMDVLTGLYSVIYKAVNAVNVTYAGLIKDADAYVNDPSATRLTFLTDYDTLLQTTRTEVPVTDPNNAILDYTRSDLWYILTHVNINTLQKNAQASIDTTVFDPNTDAYINELNRLMKSYILIEANSALNVMTQVQNYFFQQYKNFLNETSNDKNPNIRFAWVKKLGHALIEYIDVYIGGKRIDRHLGIWIDIWYQLTYSEPQIPIYDKMIGNVPELTNLDYNVKPQYDIYVPLTFWFNKYNGLSFPLVAMQYTDLRFNVKIRKFEEVAFMEKIYSATVNGSQKILTVSMIDFLMNRDSNKGNNVIENIEEVTSTSLQDILDNTNKNLYGHLYLDYVYLESPERKKFAQSGHEYLIERLQDLEFDNLNQKNVEVQLDFTNPSKEIVWVLQKDIYTMNPSGTNPCKWSDYTTGLATETTANPVIDATMTFNNYTRIQKQVGKYFDTYQPYTYHRTSPSKGINMYSFCLDPRQHQPTGSCNFTRLTYVRLSLNINPAMYLYTFNEIYPYDQNIIFTLYIPDTGEFLQTVNIDVLEQQISALEDNIDALPPDQLTLLENYNKLLDVLTKMQNGTENSISMDLYRLITFNTNAHMTALCLTLNILRVIGGYGALAYASNK
jgi:hypothetical protein